MADRNGGIVKKSLSIFLMLFLVVPMLWAQQSLLPITRVLLYKNGMAYIVRSGQITAPMSLAFHPADMNDVLKSFTAWNPNTNALYSVGYTTGIPSSRMLGRFPFDITGSDIGMGGFLAQVKGAEIHLTLDATTMEGKLAAVQPADRVITQQTTTPDYHLTVLLYDGSLKTVWLSDVKSFEFVDPQLRNQLKSYLEVLSEGRQDVTREVRIYPGATPGPIQVAYLQQFPLWKTSYRIDLLAKEGRVQGWAQIDNPTGESWSNVEVSLLSGSPVSFNMNLYDPIYTNRSTVAVPNSQVASPRQYEAATNASIVAQAGLGSRGNASGGAFDTVGGLGLDTVNATRNGMSTLSAASVGSLPLVGNNVLDLLTVTPGYRESAALQQAASPPTFQQATSTQVEDFFEYKFPFPVQLASRQSALLPFLQKKMNIERLSIFNSRTDRSNPRLGARIDNNTDIPLEAGPVTFFEDGRYAGEAVLDYLAISEKRLVSYGIDNEIQISGKQQSQPETTTRLTVAKGLAMLYMESVLTTTYEIRNKGTQKKTLIIEHPRVNNRKLKGAEPWETTDGFYRFRVTLEPGQMTTLPVSETVSRQNSLSLQNLTRPQLVLFSGKETPDTLRSKLGQIVDIQEQIATLNADVKSTQGKVDTLFQDQARLRENITALRDSREDQELHKRYIDTMNKQEDQVNASRTHIDAVNKEIAAAQTRLGDLISNLNFGG